MLPAISARLFEERAALKKPSTVAAGGTVLEATAAAIERQTALLQAQSTEFTLDKLAKGLPTQQYKDLLVRLGKPLSTETSVPPR